ncbi:BTB/POZ/Kelch-associated protein [Klebsormidium nitens]|uniref:BTB/POZ/Kelch-associated protein n=1 Tax=Klebsormidium nitens TaxID=105231 RepID=A0A1Y1IBZ9_KLENI|nr:BTB/POZ/Kelch-associated protein [Klebsormidium nitens]|eukprot:GAQ86949.1 BTB/POZ/Kelch-associated protein [Klebsormidium nitens]
MASSDGGPSSSKPRDSEDPRVFDFLPFYKQQEFCDRIIRLEILQDNTSSPVVNQAVHCTATATCTGKREANGLKMQVNIGDCGDAGERITGRKRPRDLEGAGSAGQSGSASPASDGDDRAGASKSQNDPAAEESHGEGLLEGQEDPQESAKAGESGARGLSEEEMEKHRSPLREAMICMAEGDARESTHGEDEAEEVPISAAVVAAKSDVLRTMMLSRMKESQRDAPIVLKVTQREKAAFLEMLRFIYAGRLSDWLLDPATPVSWLVDLVLAGDKFGVGSLLTSINLVLRQRLDNFAVAEVILAIPDAILSSREEFGELINNARKILVGRFKRVFDWASCSEFLALNQKAVELLLESEELEAADEEQVFRAVMTWLSSNVDEPASKQDVMRSLAPSIRFGRMRGEFLERDVLGMPEMRSVEVEALVREALSFRTWSDEEKLRASATRRFHERRGIAESNIEVMLTVRLADIGNPEASRVVQWAERYWWIKLKVRGDKQPATVGVHLYCSGRRGAPSAQRADRVNVAFYARSWRSGWWALLKKSESCWELSQADDSSLGYGDLFGMSWDEVKSSCYKTCTGEVTVKVKLSRA